MSDSDQLITILAKAGDYFTGLTAYLDRMAKESKMLAIVAFQAQCAAIELAQKNKELEEKVIRLEKELQAIRTTMSSD